MITTIPVDQLADAAGYAAGMLPGRPALPTDACVRIAVAAGARPGAETTTITGTAAQEGSASTVLATPGAEPGIVLVPGKVLADWAGKLKTGGEVTLTAEPGAGGLVMTCSAAEAGLVTMDPADYPDIAPASAPVGTCDAAALARGLSRVLPAASGSRPEPQMHAVQVAFIRDGDRSFIQLTCTDGYRFADYSLPYTPADGAPDVPVLLLADHCVKPLVSGLPDDGEVAISIAEHEVPVPGGTETQLTAVTFRASGGRSLTSRVIPGKPPLRHVLANFDREHQSAVRADAGPLMEALSRVTAVMPSSTAAVFLMLGATELGVRLATDPGYATPGPRAALARNATDSVASLPVGPAEPEELAFASSYLTTCLQAFGAAATVQLELSRPDQGRGRLLIVTSDPAPDGTRLRYVIIHRMPQSSSQAA